MLQESDGDATEPGKKESVKFTPAPPVQPKPLTGKSYRPIYHLLRRTELSIIS